MFKNVIIAILILIILLGAGAYWYTYIREPVIDPPVVTFTPTIIETPIPTQPPVIVQTKPTPIPAHIPTPTVDPYWVPGDWGPYVYG